MDGPAGIRVVHIDGHAGMRPVGHPPWRDAVGRLPSVINCTQSINQGAAGWHAASLIPYVGDLSADAAEKSPFQWIMARAPAQDPPAARPGRDHQRPARLAGSPATSLPHTPNGPRA